MLCYLQLLTSPLDFPSLGTSVSSRHIQAEYLFVFVTENIRSAPLNCRGTYGWLTNPAGSMHEAVCPTEMLRLLGICVSK